MLNLQYRCPSREIDLKSVKWSQECYLNILFETPPRSSERTLNLVKMKTRLNYFAIFSIIFLTISCGNADDDVNFDINQNELGLGETADECLGFGENQLLMKKRTWTWKLEK